MSGITLSPTAIATLEEELHQLQITACIATASLGMYIWDICTNLADEYKLIVKCKPKPFPTIVYFVARLSSLSFFVCHTLSHTTRIDCHSLSRATFTLIVISLSTVTFLFFLRLRAIYYDNRWIVATFFILWLGNVACASMSAIIYGDTTAIDFGGTVSCIEEDIKTRYASVTVIGALVHDTCVFLAISYRLFRNGQSRQSEVTGFRGTTEKYILGRNLPRFSRALFQDGQLLYLITLVASTSTTIMLYIPSIPTAYRLIADVPQVAILSSLACAVFRNLRLGKISDSEALSFTSVDDLPWHATTGTSRFSTQTHAVTLPAFDRNQSSNTK